MVDTARFIELLFADQSLDELLNSSGVEGLPFRRDVWGLLKDAATCLHRQQRTRALELLLEVTSNPNIETRLLLWSWATLRDLGVHPKPEDAAEIKGVVIQVPIEKGVDVLAAYIDGTARYVNHTGKIIVWDLPDIRIKSIICTLLNRSKAIGPFVSAALADPPGEDVLRVTLLTLSGNRFAEYRKPLLETSLINQVLIVGAELMGALTKRANQVNQ